MISDLTEEVKLGADDIRVNDIFESINYLQNYIESLASSYGGGLGGQRFVHQVRNFFGITTLQKQQLDSIADILSFKFKSLDFTKLFEEMYKNKSSEYVFINPKTSLPYTDIKKAWTTALKEAKIENFRFHDLRHTVGTRLAKENVPINIIKEILAHSDIKTTMRYVHCTQGAKTEALSKLNSYH